IGDEQAVYADPADADMLANLAAEDEWNARWGGVLKTSVNFPEPQFAVAKHQVLDGADLYEMPFIIKQGQQVGEFEKLEPKLATTLIAAPFTSIVGYPGPGGRPGDRHPQAFAVRYATAPVPASPDRLAPSRQIAR